MGKLSRRKYVAGAGGAAALGLAGCLNSGGSETTTDGGDGGGGDTTTTQQTSSKPQSITIGSDIPYPPFEFETTSGELKGFDVDIAGAVFGDQLGMEPKFKDTSFDTIIPSLNNKNFRVIMSAMTITDKRAEKVDFSDPYFTAYQTIVVKENSSITKKEDLKGKTVGVQKGTTGEGAAQKLKSDFNGDLQINSYDQIAAAFSSLLNNQVAAVINDNTVSAEYVSKKPDDLRFLEGDGAAEEAGRDAPPYLTLTIEDYGIAFRQDDDDLREQVNEALQTIRDNGTYDEIYNEYFKG